MGTAFKVLAWIMLLAGLVINLVFLFSPNAGQYPMWALAPVLMGVALLVLVIARRRSSRGGAAS